MIVKTRAIGTSALVGTDQALSSLSNVMLPLLVAGVTTSSQYGYFLTAYSALALMLAVSRGSLSVPISMASSSTEGVRRETGLALTTLITLGPAILGVMLGVPLLAGSSWTPMYAVLAIGALFTLIQDNLRYAGVARGRIGLVLISDALWLGIICLAIPLRMLQFDSSITVATLWAIGALVAMVVLSRLNGPLSRPRKLREAWTVHGKGRVHLVVAAVSASGSVLVASIVIARIAGPTTNAALGGAGQLMAPVNVLISLLGLSLLPLAAKRAPQWSRIAFAMAGGTLALVSVTWGAALLLVPSSIGILILGSTWDIAREVFFPVAVATGAVALGVAGSCHLMRLAIESTLARMRLAQGLLRIGGTILAATIWGTAVALAAIEVVVTTLFAASIWRVAWSGGDKSPTT